MGILTSPWVGGAVGASADAAATLQMTASVVVADRVGPVVAERFCKACEEPALRAVVHDLVRSLIESAAVGAGRTLVTVTATPAGAWISWDGSLVPSSVVDQASYARIATTAGPHTLTVESPGFASQILPVVARDGTPQDNSLYCADQSNHTDVGADEYKAN